MKLIVAVSCVMNSGPCTFVENGRVFYMYICSFSTIFYAISISDICRRSRKSITKPNFDKISQSTAEIELLPVYEIGRPPYWNSIYCFYFDVCISHRRVSKFRRDRMIGGCVMTSYRILNMADIQSEISSRLQV